MQSESPPTPPAPPTPSAPRPGVTSRPRRPLLLLVSLVSVWFVGMSGATGGWQTMAILRDPEAMRNLTARITDMQLVKRHEALIDALLSARSIAAPVAAGELILGSLVTIAAGLILMGRGQARTLLTQAIAAYSAFLPIAYIIQRPIRAARIDVLATDPAIPTLEGVPSDDAQRIFRAMLWWASRGALVLQLAILGAAMFALTRPRVRAFLAASPRSPAPGP